MLPKTVLLHSVQPRQGNRLSTHLGNIPWWKGAGKEKRKRKHCRIVLIYHFKRTKKRMLSKVRGS